MTVTWDPVVHLGPVPINWYGLGWVTAFLAGLWLVRRWTPGSGLSRDHLENRALWSLAGALIGARVYLIAERSWRIFPRAWRIFMLWEGGLAFFGGLFNAILATFVYARRHAVPFARAADLFAPAIPVAAAIGRIRAGWREWTTALPLAFDGLSSTPIRLLCPK